MQVNKTVALTTGIVGIATLTVVVVNKQLNITTTPPPPPFVNKLVLEWEYEGDMAYVSYFQFYEVTNIQTGGRKKAFQVPAPLLRCTNYFTNKQSAYFVNTTVGIDGTESLPNIKTRP